MSSYTKKISMWEHSFWKGINLSFKAHLSFHFHCESTETMYRINVNMESTENIFNICPLEKAICIQVKVINCCYIFFFLNHNQTHSSDSLNVRQRFTEGEFHSPFSPCCLHSLPLPTSKTFLNGSCSNLASQCTWVVQGTLHSTLTQFQRI